MSENSSDKETKFWEFIKECMQERLQQIGTEGLEDEKYQELDKELTALALQLKEILPEEKWELVDEYINSMAEEEFDGSEVFFWQGFVDGARMLWEQEGRV